MSHCDPAMRHHGNFPDLLDRANLKDNMVLLMHMHIYTYMCVYVYVYIYGVMSLAPLGPRGGGKLLRLLGVASEPGLAELSRPETGRAERAVPDRAGPGRGQPV
jgi:hypothetical protein